MSADDRRERPSSGNDLVLRSPAIWSFQLRHLLVLVFVASLIFWAASSFGGMAALALVVLAVGYGVVAKILAVRRRSTQQDSLVQTLAIAASRGLPLAPAVTAFSEACGGRFRRAVQALASELEQGMALGDALRANPGLLSREAVFLAQVGSDTGTFAKSAREIAELPSGSRVAWRLILARITYFLGVVCILQGILAFLAYFILPKFEAIFKDFGVSLPPEMMFLIGLSHFAINSGAILLILVFELALGLYLPMALVGWSHLHIPIIDRLFARRHSALVLRGLALVVEGGWPMFSGLETIGRSYPTAWVRKRLLDAATDVRLGTEWTQALVGRELLAPADAAFLESANRAGNLDWALREAAASAERKLALRLQVALDVGMPILLMLLGTVVGAIAITFFLPLATMIERLS